MTRLRLSPLRPGFTRSDLLALVFALAMAFGVLLPGCRQVYVGDGASARSQSMNNLKQMGLAIHIGASANNGKIWVGDATSPQGGKGNFWIQLLPIMEGDTIYNNIGGAVPPYPSFKPFYAPLDSLNDPEKPWLSYGLNGYFVNRGTTKEGPFQTVEQGGVKDGWMVMPDTFNKRGTSNTVGIAERTANNKRTYHDKDIYFSPPHISAFPTTSAGFDFADATAFTATGTQVLMMDGSVRSVAVARGGTVAGDNSIFDIACSLDNPRKLPDDW